MTLFSCYLVTDEKDWSYINKIRELRDGDIYTEMKSGNIKPKPQSGDIGNFSPNASPVIHTDKHSSTLAEDTGPPIQETGSREHVC